jgi:hypothetical protein
MKRFKNKSLVFIFLLSAGLFGEFYTARQVLVSGKNYFIFYFFIHIICTFFISTGGSGWLKQRGNIKSVFYSMNITGLILPWIGSLINIIIVFSDFFSGVLNFQPDMPYKYNKKVLIDPYENMVANYGIDGMARVEASIQPVKDIFKYGTESQKRGLLLKSHEYGPIVHMNILRTGLDDQFYSVRTISANLISATEKKWGSIISMLTKEKIFNIPENEIYGYFENLIKYIYLDLWDKRISAKIIKDLEKALEAYINEKKFSDSQLEIKNSFNYIVSRLEFLKERPVQFDGQISFQGTPAGEKKKIDQKLPIDSEHPDSIKDMLSIQFKKGDFEGLYKSCLGLFKKKFTNKEFKNYELFEAAHFFITQYEAAYPDKAVYPEKKDKKEKFQEQSE